MYHVNSIHLAVHGFDYSFSVHGRSSQGVILHDALFRVDGEMRKIYESGGRDTLSHTFTRVVENWKKIRCFI